MYGNVMRDGKALVISTRSFCHTFRYGRPNASMPENFLPITVVYDNPDTLEFGVAYMSDDAYENSSSVMRFVDARVESLDRVKLGDLLRRQKPNVVRSHTNRNVFSNDINESGKRRHIGTDCIGVARYPLADDLKSDVQKQWPADRPRYWQPADDKEFYSLESKTDHFSKIRGKMFHETVLVAETGKAGLPRREGGGVDETGSLPSANRWPSGIPSSDCSSPIHLFTDTAFTRQMQTSVVSFTAHLNRVRH